MISTSWHRGAIHYDTPKVMGVLNLTPDSFSDGGRYIGGGAVEHVFDMIDAGADIIDIGGESTRPASLPVTAEEEKERVISLLREIMPSVDVPVSIDTMKTSVAEAALDAGVDIINDVYGLRDEGMLELVASADVPVVIMHMYGIPETMQKNPMKGDAIPQIRTFLNERVDEALNMGVKKQHIIIDPGVGFGKTVDQNVKIVDNVDVFSEEYPTLIGASRKGFLAKIYPNMDREKASVEIAKRAVMSGANIVRVHDVKATVNALKHME